MWCFIVWNVDSSPSFPCHLAIFLKMLCHRICLLSDVSSSHMFVILLWFLISLSGVMFYHPNNWCLAIFAMLSCYIFADVLPLHMFVADVSPSLMFVILLWFLMSLLGVMFYRLNCWCLAIFAMLPCYFLSMFRDPICLFLMFRHRISLLSYFHSQYHI